MLVTCLFSVCQRHHPATNGERAGRCLHLETILILGDLSGHESHDAFEKAAVTLPVVFFGSLTNLPMTRSEPAPTVKVEPSTRSTCTNPPLVVSMRSL